LEGNDEHKQEHLAIPGTFADVASPGQASTSPRNPFHPRTVVR